MKNGVFTMSDTNNPFAAPTPAQLAMAQRLTQSVVAHNTNAMHLQALVTEFRTANPVAGSALPLTICLLYTSPSPRDRG